MEQTAEQVTGAMRSPQPARHRSTRISLGARFAKLQPRWPAIVAATVVGAALGLLLTMGPPVYNSTATVGLTESSGDSVRVKQVAQTVELTAMSNPVLGAAAESTGTDTQDLAARTSVLWQDDTDIVYVTVRGSDQSQVIAEANAIVEALGDSYDEQTRGAIEALSAQGNELIRTGRLNEQSAEAARRSGVGAALANQQGTAAAGFTTVRPLEPAEEAEATGLSTPIAVVLGAFVGGAASSAAALLLPFRRRRVRSAADVPVLLPGTRAIDSDQSGAAELVGSFLDSGCSDLAVVVADDVEEQALYFASDVTILLRAHGVPATIMDATKAPGSNENHGSSTPDDLAAFQFLGRLGRSEARARNNASALVIVAAARTQSLSLLSGQADLMAAVAVRGGSLRTEELRDIMGQLERSNPFVVMVP